MNRRIQRQNLMAISSVVGIVLLVGSMAAFGKEKPFPKAPDDMPQNMQTCPEYGPGFFKAPGSRTCIQVGGRIRGETGIKSGGGRRSDAIDWRSEGSFNLDTRDSSSNGRLVIRLKGTNSSR